MTRSEIDRATASCGARAGGGKADFVARYGGVYEHSPWVAEAAFGQPGIDTLEGLHAAMRAAVENAGEDRQLTLLRAHPELACRRADSLSAESAGEQRGAGLDRCTAEEFAEFGRLNSAYRRKFGFPFIVAVKGLDRQAILAALRRRLENGRQTEFRTALDQVHRIARFRLEALCSDVAARSDTVFHDTP